ncbi:MAG: hypothetical protein J1F11_04545 [Oscillospiraceae bacterium]|nr:hypothetical protein [Oscillospiraceae bacterium]
MFKRILSAKRILAAALAAVTAAAAAVSMSGCSEYTMTEEDLELQKSLVGFWAVDDTKGQSEYNEYDENGILTMMTAIQFTDDFKYLLYQCYLQDNYVMTFEPVSYTIEDGKFRVEENGKASYAGVSISGDGKNMSWITNESTDPYIKFSAEKAAELGIPEYDPETWKETESDGSGDGSDSAEDPAVSEDTGAEETSAEESSSDE